ADDRFEPPPLKATRIDAEIAADFDEDVADRMSAEPLGDFLRRGKGGEDGVWGCGAGAWFALGGCGTGGTRPACGLRIAWERSFEGRRQLQATGEAGDDQGNVPGAEADRDGEDEHRGGAAGQVLDQQLAAGDELVEEVAQAGGAGGCVGRRLILEGIGVWGWVSGAGQGRHERKKNTS